VQLTDAAMRAESETDRDIAGAEIRVLHDRWMEQIAVAGCREREHTAVRQFAADAE
jgi:hypothetical protein